MALLSISEFDNVVTQNYGTVAVECLPTPLRVQTDVTIPTDTSAAAAASFGSDTRFVRIYAQGDCRVAVDGTSYEVFPAGTVEVRKIKSGATLGVKRL